MGSGWVLDLLFVLLLVFARVLLMLLLLFFFAWLLFVGFVHCACCSLLIVGRFCECFKIFSCSVCCFCLKDFVRVVDSELLLRLVFFSCFCVFCLCGCFVLVGLGGIECGFA